MGNPSSRTATDWRTDSRSPASRRKEIAQPPKKKRCKSPACNRGNMALLKALLWFFAHCVYRFADVVDVLTAKL